MDIPQLTFTRFIAALGIVFFHYYSLHYPFNIPFIQKFVHFSYIFVTYFFLLSGFILVVSRKTPKINIKSYVYGRIGRIYPVYVFSMLLTIGLLIIKTNHSTQLDINQLLLEIFMIHAWIPIYAGGAYNYPDWSLSVEIFFYASFPLLLNLITNISTPKKIILAFLVYFASLFVTNYCLRQNYSELFIYYFPLLHLSSFIIGMIGAMIFKKYYTFLLLKKTLIHTASLGAFIVLAIFISTDNPFVLSYSRNTLLAPFFLLVIYSLALSKGFLTTLFTKTIFIYLGEISYSIYILQCPIMILLKDVIGETFNIGNGKIHQLLYLPALLIFSALTYKYIEVPSRTFFKKLSPT